MTPAEHYAEAQRLLVSMHDVAGNYPDVGPDAQVQAMRDLTAIAQVHATLATCDPARVQPQPFYVWDTPSPAGPPEGENQ